MTLHEAMRLVLQGQPRFSASVRMLSDEIASAGLYRWRNGGTADAHQISARARRYKHLFRIAAPRVIERIAPD